MSSTLLNNVGLASTYAAPGVCEFDAGYGLDLDSNSVLALLKYTKGSESSIECKVEVSPSNDVPGSETWHQETEYSAAAPSVASLKERQFSASGNYIVPITQIPASADNIRLSFKRTGGVTSDTAEVSTVTTVADVAGSLNNTHFFLNEPSGNGHYVWFNVNAAGADPGPFGARVGVEVALATNATADDVAAAVQAAVDPLGSYAATVLTNVVTVTNSVVGVVTDLTAENSGFGVAVTTQGGIAPKVTLVV